MTSRAAAILLRRRNAIRLLAIDEVLFIKGAGTYSELHLRNGRVALLNGTVLPVGRERYKELKQVLG